MQKTQLQNIKRRDLWDAQCPDIPPMPRLTHLFVSFANEAVAMLHLSKFTLLQVLVIRGVNSCPSLSCLSRLTGLSLSGGFIVRPLRYSVSADSIKVRLACSTLLFTDAFA